MKNQSFNKSCKIVLNLLTFNIGKLNNIWVISKMVENSGIEPLTSCVQSRRSPSWANSPCQSLKPKQVWLRYIEVIIVRLSLCTLERRWSNRRFSYGYLVTTSPQSLIPLWAVASLAFRLRVKSTPMVWRAVSTRPGNVFTVAWLIYDY